MVCYIVRVVVAGKTRFLIPPFEHCQGGCWGGGFFNRGCNGGGGELDEKQCLRSQSVTIVNEVCVQK